MGYRTEIDPLDCHLTSARPEGEWFVLTGTSDQNVGGTCAEEQLELAMCGTRTVEDE